MYVNPYLGHPSQLCSVEEVRLTGGKGDGMRLLQLRTVAGLELTLSLDRCADLSRLIFKGDNMGFFSPTGYVAPAYHDDRGLGFLKSFTAGFLTTCGLSAVGSPCTDDGEDLPLHGIIGNTPCEHVWWNEDEDNVYVHATVSEGILFSKKLQLDRLITVSKTASCFTFRDTVTNVGDMTAPAMLLYHMNMGYPLLSERSELTVSSVSVLPRNDHAAKDLDTWAQMLPPTPGFEEQCYYHQLGDEGKATIYNPDINKGLSITFDPRNLDHFTQWKMMGYRDYVLGLEPGNCYPDGRDIVRQQGKLKLLQPGQSVTYEFTVTLFQK